MSHVALWSPCPIKPHGYVIFCFESAFYLGQMQPWTVSCSKNWSFQLVASWRKEWNVQKSMNYQGLQAIASFFFLWEAFPNPHPCLDGFLPMPPILGFCYCLCACGWLLTSRGGNFWLLVLVNYMPSRSRTVSASLIALSLPFHSTPNIYMLSID